MEKKVIRINIRSSCSKLVDNNFRALRNPNYRYFWLGQCVSLIGTWMQTIGQAWLVYSMTKSAVLLGVLGAAQFLPVTLLTLFAGVFVDKFPKKNILLATQSAAMLLALTLAALVFTHTARYEYILILAILLGVTNAVDMPTRQSFMIEIAGREDLMNAIALNSVVFNLAKILGPALGAVLLASLGAGWCFLFNGLSFIAVIFGISLIKVKPYVREKSENSILQEVKDGLRYIYTDRILFQTVLFVLVIGIFAFNYNVFIPVFVKEVLHHDAQSFGMLMAALGIGSIFGALSVAGSRKSGPKMKVLFLSCLAIGVLLFAFGYTTQYIAAIILMVALGAFSIYFSTTANSTLQIHSQDAYRGRVMSVYSLVFAGATPIGSLFSGASISRIGVLDTLRLSGILAASLTLVILLIFHTKHKTQET